ncbi:Ureidoacrylate amidohydrolase [Hyphodiscus hymeniophilus]|uniref:Ureidoacrylate amidohydrolase n=1 Tax=Hyphodiscus hymeniophilus TaxID=353542 RepID=A0A9P7AZF7_9HELO|nr:Ureidoacrylate amidohydrolase [Hyphodiscus hymeniophilus]
MVQLDSAPALLVVDMQNGFCHNQGSFAKLGMQSDPTAIVPHINELRSAFRAAGIPVFFLRTAYKADYSDRRSRSAGDRLEKLQGLIRGSWDVDILDELTPESDEKIIDKTRNSGFFPGTALEDTLKERGVNHLILTGVGTDVCVESTARDAYQLDFAVTTVSDATGTCNEPDHLAALHALRMFGGTASTADVIEALPNLRDLRLRIICSKTSVQTSGEEELLDQLQASIKQSEDNLAEFSNVFNKIQNPTILRGKRLGVVEPSIRLILRREEVQKYNDILDSQIALFSIFLIQLSRLESSSGSAAIQSLVRNGFDKLLPQVSDVTSSLERLDRLLRPVNSWKIPSAADSALKIHESQTPWTSPSLFAPLASQSAKLALPGRETLAHATKRIILHRIQKQCGDISSVAFCPEAIRFTTVHMVQLPDFQFWTCLAWSGRAQQILLSEVVEEGEAMAETVRNSWIQYSIGRLLLTYNAGVATSGFKEVFYLCPAYSLGHIGRDAPGCSRLCNLIQLPNSVPFIQAECMDIDIFDERFISERYILTFLANFRSDLKALMGEYTRIWSTKSQEHFSTEQMFQEINADSSCNAVKDLVHTIFLLGTREMMVFFHANVPGSHDWSPFFLQATKSNDPELFYDILPLIDTIDNPVCFLNGIFAKVVSQRFGDLEFRETYFSKARMEDTKKESEPSMFLQFALQFGVNKTDSETWKCYLLIVDALINRGHCSKTDQGFLGVEIRDVVIMSTSYSLWCTDTDIIGQLVGRPNVFLELEVERKCGPVEADLSGPLGHEFIRKAYVGFTPLMVALDTAKHPRILPETDFWDGQWSMPQITLKIDEESLQILEEALKARGELIPKNRTEEVYDDKEAVEKLSIEQVAMRSCY